MLFRTELHLAKSAQRISHSDKLMSIGSCFADCMGQRFDDLQFDIISNPFGVLYNPLSIFGNLSFALTESEIDFTQIIQYKGRFFHYQFHSEVSAKSDLDLKNQLERIRSEVKQSLKDSSCLFITLGTAFVYALKQNEVTVANCHKMPSDLFEKRMLNVQEIVTGFNQFYTELKSLNPDIKIVVTVSPVRHTKDTIELNAVSKAVLRLACHEIVVQNTKNVSYFPAFEIMMDDLRDYRFYKEDLIHPNIQAETYIWEKFSNAYFGEDTLKLNKEIAEIQTSLSHRPFNTESGEYGSFLKNCEEKILKLKDKIPTARLLEKLALKLSA